MKVSVLLLVCFAVQAFGIPLSEDQPNVIIEDGLKHVDDLETMDAPRVPVNNGYSLYTRNNPTSGQELLINVESSIAESNFNAEHTTVVIIHGWLRHQIDAMSNTLRDSILQMEEANIIIVNWRVLAMQDYSQSVLATPHVGRAIGQFLAYLNEVSGASYESMHLIGFSLGAHAAGVAGRELDGKIARITGLDPAGPLFNLNPNRLGKDDAVYVENIHTNGGVGGHGIGTPIGDVDFFPNGGGDQPGCLTDYCDHNRAWQFLDATIKYNHLMGNECSTMLQVHLNSCRGRPFHMGNNNLNKSGSGLYRVNTGRRYPY